MQRRVARVTLILLLLTATVTTSFVLLALERRNTASITAHSDVSARLARISETVTGIGVAQLGYLAPGQLDQPWFQRTSTLIDRLSAELNQARADVRSPEGRDGLAALTETAGALAKADLRARQNLRLGQDLMAVDVILSDGLNLVDTMTAAIRRLQDAERAQRGTELRAIARARWITLGMMATLLVAGLLALAPVSEVQPVQEPAGLSLQAAANAEIRSELPLPLPTHRDADLTSIAHLCTDLSRVTTTEALPDLLSRSARALDASGLILWLGAGDQLFPAMAHGYPTETVSRLEPVARDARNAAAAAWRTGERTIVDGTLTSAGAVVVPLLGVGGCLGVLAFEVPHGRELDSATHAIAALIAAQLAAVVPIPPVDTHTLPSAAAMVGLAQESPAHSA